MPWLNTCHTIWIAARPVVRHVWHAAPRIGRRVIRHAAVHAKVAALAPVIVCTSAFVPDLWHAPLPAPVQVLTAPPARQYGPSAPLTAPTFYVPPSRSGRSYPPCCNTITDIVPPPPVDIVPPHQVPEPGTIWILLSSIGLFTVIARNIFSKEII